MTANKARCWICDAPFNDGDSALAQPHNDDGKSEIMHLVFFHESCITPIPHDAKKVVIRYSSLPVE